MSVTIQITSAGANISNTLDVYTSVDGSNFTFFANVSKFTLLFGYTFSPPIGAYMFKIMDLNCGSFSIVQCNDLIVTTTTTLAPTTTSTTTLAPITTTTTTLICYTYELTCVVEFQSAEWWYYDCNDNVQYSTLVAYGNTVTICATSVQNYDSYGNAVNLGLCGVPTTTTTTPVPTTTTTTPALTTTTTTPALTTTTTTPALTTTTTTPAPTTTTTTPAPTTTTTTPAPTTTTTTLASTTTTTLAPTTTTTTTFMVDTFSIMQGSFALKTDQMWVWGFNANGQLGDNSLINKCTPVSIQGFKKTFCKVAAGYDHTIGLDNNGQVWCWGINGDGRLGDNSTSQRITPVSIRGAKKTFCQISAGYSHSIALDNNSQVWCWGSNLEGGQLGNNSTVSRCTPVSIHGTKKTFCRISAASYHNLGIDYTGQVWCWGRNDSGQLGDNSILNKCTPISIRGSKKTFCRISVGSYVSSAIDYTGQVWCWGKNTHGELGINSTVCKCTPVSIFGAKKTFCQISNGYNGTTIGLDKYGQVWGWGYNNYGQIGDNSGSIRCTPVSIAGTKKTFCQIKTGNYFSMGIDNYGHLWSWGLNGSGELGVNSILSKMTPVRVCNF